MTQRKALSTYALSAKYTISSRHSGPKRGEGGGLDGHLKYGKPFGLSTQTNVGPEILAFQQILIMTSLPVDSLLQDRAE